VFNRVVLIAAGLVLGASTALAGTPPKAAAPQDAPHRNYDQKMRDCRKLGTESGLSGDALRGFIADCMKK